MSRPPADFFAGISFGARLRRQRDSSRRAALLRMSRSKGGPWNIYGARRRSIKYSGRRKSRSAVSTARIALREVRKMRRDQEVKFLTAVTGVTQIPIGGAALVDGFGPYLAQGTSVTTRLGDKISIQSLSMRFNIKLAALEADGVSVRLLVVYDRLPSGADAGVTDMLTADSILAPYQILEPFRGRFQFLADRTIEFSANEGEFNDTLFIKRTFNVKYNGNAANVTDCEKGNFLVVGLSRGNAAAIDIDYSYRFRFTDD